MQCTEDASGRVSGGARSTQHPPMITKDRATTVTAHTHAEKKADDPRHRRTDVCAAMLACTVGLVPTVEVRLGVELQVRRRTLQAGNQVPQELVPRHHVISCAQDAGGRRATERREGRTGVRPARHACGDVRVPIDREQGTQMRPPIDPFMHAAVP